MPHIPGREIFLERSELNRPVNGLLALVALIVAALAAAGIFRAIDGAFVASTLVSQALVMILALTIISVMISKRRALQARWGARAFSRAFRWLAIPGLTIIGVGLAHFTWIEGERVVPRQVALVPIAYLLITGLVLWARAIMVFGIDNLSLMYVYYPAESRLVDAKIYSVVRHPVYSAVLRIAFALILNNGSAFALFAGLMAPLTMWLWVRNVEEAELIDRFGDGYRAYRARVPAFFNLDPRVWLSIWQFLLTGK